MYSTYSTLVYVHVNMYRFNVLCVLTVTAEKREEEDDTNHFQGWH